MHQLHTHIWHADRIMNGDIVCEYFRDWKFFRTQETHGIDFALHPFDVIASPVERRIMGSLDSRNGNSSEPLHLVDKRQNTDQMNSSKSDADFKMAIDGTRFSANFQQFNPVCGLLSICEPFSKLF